MSECQSRAAGSCNVSRQTQHRHHQPRVRVTPLARLPRLPDCSNNVLNPVGRSSPTAAILHVAQMLHMTISRADHRTCIPFSMLTYQMMSSCWQPRLCQVLMLCQVPYLTATQRARAPRCCCGPWAARRSCGRTFSAGCRPDDSTWTGDDPTASEPAQLPHGVQGCQLSSDDQLISRFGTCVESEHI